MNFLLGVDLGQAQDFTALCILERSSTHDDNDAPVYAARHLERLPIGTPYPVQVARVKALHDRLKAEGHEVRLVVDQTGVGRPVVDMLREAQLSPIAITITGGDTVTREGSAVRVPKRDLVSTVAILLQSERLKIAKGLPEAQTLVDELLAFKVSITTTGHDRYGNDVGMWRENPHDDLVLAVALATWYGENRVPQTVIPTARVHYTAR